MSDAEKNGSTLQFGLKEAIPILAPWLIFAGGLIFAQANWIPPLPKAWQGFLTAPRLTTATTGLLSFAGSLWQLWRNRRKHAQGKVQPGKVAIWVAELEGDGKQGAHRTNIVQTLKRELEPPSRFFAPESNCGRRRLATRQTKLLPPTARRKAISANTKAT